MSIAVKTPPQRSDDRDAQFINYQEEFRRSKRNSLIWSSLLLVASVASIPLDGDALRVAGTSLFVPQPMLVIMLAVAALFFFLSYLRSLSVIIPLNSEAAKNESELWADSGSIMKGIKSKLAGPENNANDIINEMSNIKKHIDIVNSMTSHLASNLDRDVDDQNFKLAQSNFENALSAKRGSIGSLKKDADRLIEKSKIRHNQAGSAIKIWREESAQAKIHLENFEKMTDERISRILSALDGIENSLSIFRSAILGREKAWHWSLDRLAVMGLFAMAIAVASYRTMSPEQLDRAVLRFTNDPAPALSGSVAERPDPRENNAIGASAR